MFVDDASGVGLWRGGATYPDELPLSARLAADVQAWVDEWTLDFTAPDFDEEAHDWRGHALSLRIQDELGDGYSVTFIPQSRVVTDALRGSATD
ncbi:hypothetical protein [Nocardioides sp. Arc9.136]|uniref:hypothetical protein n=1 Tax=Nocardioides sp. Arc9.136 TaxID=2996826 RepID=UPI002666E7DA|nr:hypothetical protein [Nocardioides sp. Arc9.136]WKN48911.1 hypothetical protein OSR43_01955 [Nocardioides sp. Arc9.136]